jgi:gliding motility-associated lipoprotein GldH
MKGYFFSGLIATFYFFASCDEGKVFHKYAEIPGNTWNAKNIIHFDVPIADTLSSHNVYILVRNNSNYAYSNLYLFVTTTSPLGYTVSDTVEIILANQRGKWTGKGAADIYTSRHPYKMNVRFPYCGIYAFDIEQALWEKDLKNISDIGLEIDRIPRQQ